MVTYAPAPKAAPQTARASKPEPAPRERTGRTRGALGARDAARLQASVGNQAVLRYQRSTGSAASARTPPAGAAGSLDETSPLALQLARSGLSGSPAAMPHADALQRSFGAALDVSTVRAFVGGAAATAARGLGASGYSLSGAVAFPSPPDLRLAAHEVAHVAQQQRGVVARGGDPTLERHADEVADRVAAGRPAEDLFVARPVNVAAPPIVQRKKGPREEELPDDLDVDWRDPWRISFDHEIGRRDEFVFRVQYTGALKTRHKETTLTFRLTLSPDKKLTPVLQRGERSLRIDLYGDGTDTLKLTDNVKSQRGERVHSFAAERLSGGGSYQSLVVLDGTAREEKPRDAEGKTPSRPGEHPFFSGVGDSTALIDGDGDQHKELRIRIRDVKREPTASELPKRVEVTVVQLSSGLQATVTFNLPSSSKGLLFPVVKEVTDGKAPTLIHLIVPGELMLRLYPPRSVGDKIGYRLELTEGQSFAVLFPPEPKLHVVASANPPTVVGGIASADVSLGAYGDRFRITVVPAPGNGALVGVSALWGGRPLGGQGAFVQLAGPARLAVLKQDGLSLSIDLDGDGGPDLQVFDRLDAPDFRDRVDPERVRDHRIRLVGPGLSRGEVTFDFVIRGASEPSGYGTSEASMLAASNALAVTSLPLQRATFEADLDRVEQNLQTVRSQAADDGIIARTTYDAWARLARAMIKLRAENTQAVSASTQGEAAAAADAFYSCVADETRTSNRSTFTQVGTFTTNPFTGMQQSDVAVRGRSVTGFGPELGAKIRKGQGFYEQAITDYNLLVSGLDLWIVKQLRARDDLKPRAATAGYLEAAKSALGAIESRKPTRIQAVFHPEEGFRESGRLSEMPLSLYYWKDGGTWHLADLTNPLDTFEDTFDAKANENAPPPELFLKLDARIHFPRGIIHYQIPHGDAGAFRTHAETSWTDYLAYIGLGVAVIGLTLATLGTGTVAVAGAWVLAGSGLISATATAIEMAEKWEHGNLDATTAIIDIASIVASLAGSAALASMRITTMAAQAVRTGAPWAGNWARLAVYSNRLFVPLTVAKMAGDVVTGVALDYKTANDLDDIESSPGTRAAKDRAKALLLAQAVFTTGMLALSIKGDLNTTLKPGRKLILYLPPDNAPPVALVGDLVDPRTLRFSQENIGARTSDGMTIEELTENMRRGGWKGNPLEVVELPDGSRTSLDNRRLTAAVRAGLPEVPMAVHEATDKVPKDQQARYALKKDPIRKLPSGELVVGGNEGVVRYPKGSLPDNYGEAALFRTADQGKVPGTGERFPLYGRMEEPRIRVPKATKPKDPE